MRTLVTGAGGFIGSHLVEHLSSNSEVTAFVHYKSENAEGHLQGWRDSNISIVRGDVTDVDQMRRVIEGHDVVYHLAALGGPTYSFEAPAQYQRVNVGGTVAVLEAVRAVRGVGCRMVLMSTSEIYGDAQSIPMTEWHPVVPHSPYGASKAAAELFCTTFAKAFSVDVRIARCFNVFGPRQSLRAVIPNMIAQVLSGQTNIRVADPNITRDYTFVSDTVHALQLIGAASNFSGPLNVASGEARSIGDIGRTIGKLVKQDVTVTADPLYRRPPGGEVYRLHGDSTAIQMQLGWKQDTSFEGGLRETLEWIQAQPSYEGPQLVTRVS